MLHEGGVQEAEMSTAPAVCRAVTTPDVLTVAISGLEVLHVRGGLLKITSSVSTAVATIVFDPPALRLAEFPEPAWIWSMMDFTRQVV